MGLVKDVLYKTSNKKFLKIFKNQAVFPCYHIVKDQQVAHIENLYAFKNTAQFINDIEILMANYSAMHPTDLLANSHSKNTFLLTFDDGLQEIYSVIFPILKARNLSAIFFVNPSFVDNKQNLYKHTLSIIISHLKSINYDSPTLNKIAAIAGFSFENWSEFKVKFLNLNYSEREKVPAVLALLHLDIAAYLKKEQPYITKAQIQEMMDAGFYFGGHTMNHPPLQQLTHEAQKKEIIDSIEWLKENFVIDYSFFAFPFSDKNISKKLIEELFEYNPNLKIFGNSGLKKDIDSRIIQRFTLENPAKNTEKQIVTENLYKYFNKCIGKYNIKRK